MARHVSDGRRQSERYELRRLRLVADHARGRVLDLGHAQFPNPFLDGASTTGLDLERSSNETGYAREFVGSVMDVRSQMQGVLFDTVVAAELIEHLERPYDFLREIREVIAPGGQLLLTTPNPLGFPTLGLEMVRSHRWFYTTDHTYYILPRWMERMLTATGFEVLRLQPVGLWLPFGYVRWCPVWASYQVLYVARPRA